jgi:ATP-dependent RNA circularization protein (DNA/RNA ligase family)
MSAFFRFPHTPHLAWLGSGAPRDDKVLSSGDARELLREAVVVEEKLDGANLGISRDVTGALSFQNRGQFVHTPYSGQFRYLNTWLAQRQSGLEQLPTSSQIIFGEWCAALHTVSYNHLPDWFITFDVYDRDQARFTSVSRRNALARDAGLAVAPELFRGYTSIQALKELLLTSTSLYGDSPIEGLVIRRESTDWLQSRAKLVHPEFVQSLGEHWRRRKIEWNRLDTNAGPASL